jgi:uncharacterized membrane protein YeaQ/YmgE (transglycosylase-associated protein family)
VRLVLGLIKGLIIGAVVGLGAYQLDLTGGMHWLTYGLVGALVGLLVGRPVWSHVRDEQSTVYVAVLKAIVGYVIGIGIYAIVAKAWGGMDISFQDHTRNLYDWQPLLGAIIGGLYGAFVEADDAPAEAKSATKSVTKAATKSE